MWQLTMKFTILLAVLQKRRSTSFGFVKRDMICSARKFNDPEYEKKKPCSTMPNSF